VHTRFLQHFDHLASAATSGNHIFNHHGTLAGLNGESAAQRHFPAIPLGEKEARSSHGPGDLVADDQTTHRRRYDYIAAGNTLAREDCG